MLRAPSGPRADAAAWEIIDLLPAHPVITAAIAGGRRKRSWEAAGLLDLMADLEVGELPA